MRARHIVAGWVGLAMVLACGGGDHTTYTPSSALFELGESEGLYIVAHGDFYPLHGELDRYGIPEPNTPTPIDGTSHYFHSITVSPDGAYLASYSNPLEGDSHKAHLVVFDEDLKVVYENLDLLKASQNHLRWSPDGQYIAFNQGGTVGVLNWETKEQKIVARDGKKPDNYSVLNPMSWSPDSTRLAYETEDKHIVVRTLDGKQTARWLGRTPAWDPTGERIAHLYSGSRTDRRRVALFDLATHESHDLFSFLVEDQLIWTPEGRFLMFRNRWVNHRSGELHFYDVEADEVFTTGKMLDSIRYAQVFPLPAKIRDRLSLFVNNDRENPNRRRAMTPE